MEKLDKLDKLDKILLAQIANNCRTPVSEMAKSIRKSAQFTSYRIERLKESSIQSIPILVDFYSIGNIEITCMIKARMIDPITEKVLIDHLIKKTNAYKIIYLSGSYNILASFIVADMKLVQEIKEEIMKVASVDIQFFTNYESRFYSINYLGEKVYSKEIIIGNRTNQNAKNKNIIEIVRVLQQNPFVSLLEISKATSLSYDQVIYSLKNNTILMGNSLIISQSSVKRQIIFFRISKKREFIEAVRNIRNITELNFIVGEYDAYTIIESTENISNISKTILFTLKDYISDYMSLDASKFYKYGWFEL